MKPLVLGAGEPATAELLGGKGVALFRLAAQDLPVPRWIALTTHATESVLGPLRGRIEEIVRGVGRGDAAAAREAAARVAALVRAAEWSDALRRELGERLGTLDAAHGLAVRSSAVDEDGADSSYAGLLATRLAVPPDGVESAVRDCWASAFSERAILYRQARALADRGAGMAVVIQEMVDARVSGIAFTADPTTGAPAHIVVAGYGLGEGVVSDRVETDTFVREMDGEGWRSTIRRKTRRVAPRRDGRPGTEVALVPPDDRDRPALAPAELERLSAALGSIEERAGGGRPQDVEWAIDRAGHARILQARPITTAPAGELAIWDDSNVGESYPGLTLPLTASYVRFVYERVFGRALRQVGLSRRAIARAGPALAGLIGVIHGRLYFNLCNYYGLFHLVPGLEGAVGQWETGLGITRHYDGPGGSRGARGWRRIWRRVLALRTAVAIGWRWLRLGADYRRFRARVEELIRRHGGVRAGECFAALYGAIERINAEYLGDWTLLVFNDLFAFRFDARLARMCGDRHRVLSGLTAVESLAPLRSLLALVAEARRVPAVEALLRSDRPADEVWAAIEASPAAAPFRGRVDAHLRRHGQRTMGELKLETTPPAEAPAELVAMLRNHLDLGLRPADLEARERASREAAEGELRRLFRGRPFRRWWALRLLRQTRRSVALRENMSYARSRAYGVLRSLCRGMGEALAQAGALAEARDVFHLTLEDLAAYARGSLPESELRGLVELRKERYRRFAEEELPHRIVCRGPVYAQRLGGGRHRAAGAPSRNGGVLRGAPCSPGLVRGIARVVRAPSPGERVDGEILVAPVTEPGWIFLMLGAKGLVVERGSVLSHAAILGRELGIPTVVGVAGATEWITSGDEIELDGDRGEVRILRAARRV